VTGSWRRRGSNGRFVASEPPRRTESRTLQNFGKRYVVSEERYFRGRVAESGSAIQQAQGTCYLICAEHLGRCVFWPAHQFHEIFPIC
jgi:hypothetical protein